MFLSTSEAEKYFFYWLCNSIASGQVILALTRTNPPPCLSPTDPSLAAQQAVLSLSESSEFVDIVVFIPVTILLQSRSPRLGHQQLSETWLFYFFCRHDDFHFSIVFKFCSDGFSMQASWYLVIIDTISDTDGSTLWSLSRLIRLQMTLLSQDVGTCIRYIIALFNFFLNGKYYTVCGLVCEITAF